MRRKRGAIPWFMYVVCVIVVVIVVANRDAFRNYCGQDDETTKDIKPQETHQARLPN
jgi:ABC-type cobalt transport system substrate-binding protein